MPTPDLTPDRPKPVRQVRVAFDIDHETAAAIDKLARESRPRMTRNGWIREQIRKGMAE